MRTTPWLVIAASTSCGGRIADEPGVDLAVLLDASVSAPPPSVDATAPPQSCGASCDDGNACTIDTCDRVARQCEHRHDDSRCPPGFLCTATGCEAVAYVNTESQLFEITLPTGIERPLTTTSYVIYDIALAQDGILYGVNYEADFRIDRTDGTVHVIDVYNGGIFDGLEASPDGTFFASGPTSVVRLVLFDFLEIAVRAGAGDSFVESVQTDQLAHVFGYQTFRDEPLPWPRPAVEARARVAFVRARMIEVGFELRLTTWDVMTGFPMRVHFARAARLDVGFFLSRRWASTPGPFATRHSSSRWRRGGKSRRGSRSAR
jgi:hypothetical protein